MLLVITIMGILMEHLGVQIFHLRVTLMDLPNYMTLTHGPQATLLLLLM